MTVHARAPKDRPARGMRRVSAASIARAAGVSTAAVSYALNGRPGVSVETRERIITLAQELGHPGPKLPKPPSRVIGLIVADLANPFYTQIAAGVVDAARAADYEVFISHAADADGGLEPLVQAMVDRGVDAVLLTVLRSDSGEAIRVLRKSHTPWVQISRRMAAVPADFVGIDDAGAARAIMNHVLDHRYPTLATIVGPRASSASATREDAFLDAARRRGVGIEYHMSVALTEDGGSEAVSHLLARGPLPRALVCGSDAIALGVLSELTRRGIRVPEDVAVTGFDGLPAALSPLIPLTTVIQPRRRMGEQAVELILERVSGSGGAIESVILDYEIRVSTSCGCTAPRSVSA